jgi:hypothetical protein
MAFLAQASAYNVSFGWTVEAFPQTCDEIGMNNPRITRPAILMPVALAAGVLVFAAAVAGWSRFGTDILLDAASTGLSWCL